MPIDGSRLWRNLDALAALTEPDRPWTRRSFTPRFMQGRAWLTQQFEAAGLAVEIDAGGNLIGRRAGAQPHLKPILIGSHSDSVPSGGRYDGMLGLLAALEVVDTLNDRGQVLAHPLEVVDFLAEEPSEFGISCIGSRALAGKLDETMLALTRPDGMSLREALAFVGGQPESLARARRAPGDITAYVELHIEQGKILERGGLDVGVVTGLAAIRRVRIQVTGRADHAGQTPMDDRADALVAAARIIDATYRMALTHSRPDQPFVATIGRIETLSPNAANAVAGYVELVLECRSADEARVQAFVPAVLGSLASSFDSLGVQVTHELMSHVAPSPCDEAIQSVIEQIADEAGYGHCRLSSGAGHDGMWVSHVGPFGMIFVPCKDGRSHTPEEWLSPEQAAVGAEALYRTVLRLDQGVHPA